MLFHCPTQHFLCIKFEEAELSWRAYLNDFCVSQKDDPLAPVRILGAACKVTQNDQNYYSAERESSLVKWNDRDDTLIDRFDGARCDTLMGQPKSFCSYFINANPCVVGTALKLLSSTAVQHVLRPS